MTTSGWAAVWALIGGTILAVVTAFINFLIQRRRDRLQLQLNFVNSQLRDFYGPLLAIADVNNRAFAVLKYRYNPQANEFWDPKRPPASEAKAAWFHWMSEIFMPNNMRMLDIIMARADLLIDNGMPQCLTEFCTHVLIVKALMPTWDGGPGSFPEIPPFPRRGLDHYLTASFTALKHDQARLMQAITASVSYPLTASVKDIELISDKLKQAEEGPGLMPLD